MKKPLTLIGAIVLIAIVAVIAYLSWFTVADSETEVIDEISQEEIAGLDELPVILDTGDDDMQTTRQVTGNVIELISDCAFDGNCAYVVETDSGESVTVIWAEGMSPICQNDPFQGGDTDIQVGDSIDSLGRVIDANTTSACGDPSYYIRKTS